MLADLRPVLPGLKQRVYYQDSPQQGHPATEDPADLGEVAVKEGLGIPQRQLDRDRIDKTLAQLFLFLLRLAPEQFLGIDQHIGLDQVGGMQLAE